MGGFWAKYERDRDRGQKELEARLAELCTKSEHSTLTEYVNSEVATKKNLEESVAEFESVYNNCKLVLSQYSAEYE
jgi:hypothetical protein